MMSSARRPNGQFAKGNPGGPGNPHAAQVAALRSALLEAVTPADIAQVVASLVTQAKAGDIAAAQVLFDRCFGRVAPADADNGGDGEAQVGWWEGISQAQARQQAILCSPRATQLACDLEEELAALAAAHEGEVLQVLVDAGAITRESWELMAEREREPIPSG